MMLGEQDTLLTARATARCAGDPLPAVSSYTFEETSYQTIAADGIFPRTAKIDDDTAIVFYTKSGNQTLYYRLVTVAEDYTTSFSAESTYLSLSPSAYTGFDVVYLQDNKIILMYRGSLNTMAVIGNHSVGVVTFGTPVTLNSELIPVLQTNQFEAARISSSSVVLCSKNTDNFKPSVQVINIGTSDVITYGTVAKTTADGGGSIASVRLAMLSETKGVLIWNSAINSRAQVFTVSGTTAAFPGTAYGFPNGTQFAGYTNYAMSNASIKAISSSQLLAVGAGSSTLAPDPTLYAPMYMVLSEASNVLTSVTANNDSTFSDGGVMTGVYPSIIVGNNDMFVLHHSTTPNPEVMHFTKLTGVSPPSVDYNIDIESIASPAAFRYPVGCQLRDYVYLGVIETTIASNFLKVFAIRAT